MSLIEWTDLTWNMLRARFTNPITGEIRTGWHCEHVSEGCRFCYAEQKNKGFFQLGTKQPYARQSREKVEVFLDEESLLKPLHWKKPRKIFVCSMTDIFGEWHTDEMIDKVFAVMALCPQHTFQVLTKRPERMLRYFREPYFPEPRIHAQMFSLGTSEQLKAFKGGWPLPNVWLGTSVEDQKTADERIPYLLQTPAALRWVSCEPLIRSVDLGRFLDPTGFQCVDPDCVHRYRPFVNEDHYETTSDNDPICDDCGQVGTWTGYEDGLDWVICGGESGPRARPFNLQWARGIIRQCKVAQVPVFVKQLGKLPFDGYLSALEVVGNGKGRPRPADQPITESGAQRILDEDPLIDSKDFRRYLNLNNKKGGDINQWPADLRVRQFPEVHHA